MSLRFEYLSCKIQIVNVCALTLILSNTQYNPDCNLKGANVVKLYHVHSWRYIDISEMLVLFILRI